jgi:hypothetical protein
MEESQKYVRGCRRGGGGGGGVGFVNREHSGDGNGVNFCNFFNAFVYVNNVLHGELVVFNNFPEEPVLTCIY